MSSARRMMGIGDLAKKVFGSHNTRRLKSVGSMVERINALESDYAVLDPSGIRQKTDEFRRRLTGGESVDALLPEAFALTREAGKQALGLRIFDVQMMGGIFLHQGNIAEMKTGEGKTLVATLPAYLNALAGKNVHIVTVNDYLARRDADWMGMVYSTLGITVGVAVPDMAREEKRQAYACDVTYATNNELGFDYLRDNMVPSLDLMVQRGHDFAIVDEVDSILIDEARTPLVISGPAEDRSELYQSIDGLMHEVGPDDYVLDEKTRNVTLTDAGNEHLEELLRSRELLRQHATLYDPESATLVHHVTQALRAHKCFNRDREYIVRGGQVVLIDEFTGRMMSGRRLSEGLHQAIEAKERVEIQAENTTLASVTFQNYFRLYDKLAGMTGTAATEAEEFESIYGLGVVEVPTNEPVARIDEDDKIYRTVTEKYAAIVNTIAEAYANRQPVLVGTTSIEKSEHLSELLKKRKLKHNVLNARYHEQEARIVADAGRPGTITIATNMAGRGTDIQLGGNVEMRVLEALDKGPDSDVSALRVAAEAEIAGDRDQVLKSGGLFVLATERHESRRIDNQLRGRSGRQGDPGKSSFFLSLEDDLMRIFGSDRLDKVLNTIGMEEGEAIVHPWVNKSLERAQAKVEGRNFEIRKQLLKYDDVMNDQRKVIFNRRLEIMRSDDVSEMVRDMRHDLIGDLVDEHIPEDSYPDQWEMEELARAMRDRLGVDVPLIGWAEEDGVTADEVVERLCTASDERQAQRRDEFGPEWMQIMEKRHLLEALDQHWRDHLVTLEHLRSVIGFRGYAQRDPLIEFKQEGFELFQGLLNSVQDTVATNTSLARPLTPEQQRILQEHLQREHEQRMQASKPRTNRRGTPAAQNRSEMVLDLAKAVPANRAIDAVSDARAVAAIAPGRNSPCPCGSGKKFKHCCGKR